MNMKCNYRYRIFHVSFTEQDSNRKHSVRISIKTNDLGNARRQIAEKYHAENVLLTYVTTPDKEKI